MGISEGRQSGVDEELEETEQDLWRKRNQDEPPMIKPGILKVIVFKGSELVNKDMIGKSDPFIKIKFKEQEFKSKKIRNSLEPEWNFSADLIVPSSQENSDIVIEVYDDDFGKENFIGSFTLPLTQAIKHTDKEASWGNLDGCKTGKISFATYYSPDDKVSDDEKELKDTTQDSFINDIYTLEGRQASNTEGETIEKGKVEHSEEDEQEKEEELVQQQDTEPKENEKVEEVHQTENRNGDKNEIQITKTTQDPSAESIKDTKEDVFSIKPGLLKVIVFKGSELVNKDMIGKSDPFLKIKFGDQELKSPKVRNSLEPEWNFSANLTISSDQENNDIVIEVYDDDFGKENFIGSYNLPLKQAIEDTDKEASWNNLVGCKTGRISFSTFYSPDDLQKDDNSEKREISQKTSGETEKRKGRAR